MPHLESWEKLQCDDHSGSRDLYYIILLLYNWGSWGLRQNHVASCNAIKRLSIITNSTHYLFLYFTNDSIDVSRKFPKAVKMYQNTRHLRFYIRKTLNLFYSIKNLLTNSCNISPTLSTENKIEYQWLVFFFQLNNEILISAVNVFREYCSDI